LAAEPGVILAEQASLLTDLPRNFSAALESFFAASPAASVELPITTTWSGGPSVPRVLITR
jgi:hypothetical protein